MNETLKSAIESESADQIAVAMLESEFLCVDVTEKGQSDTAALVIETGKFSALVGFTSEDHAGTFAEYSKEVPLDDNDELRCFEVSGREFLTTLPKNFGLAINLETEHEVIFDPKFVRLLKIAAQ